VVISGLDGEELSRNCLDLGAVALLKKPFDIDKFNVIADQLFQHRRKEE
jgi:DNA-binding response OmpR family regulator